MKCCALLMTLALLLAGCARPPEEPLRIGTNLWLGYEPLYLARSEGVISPKTAKLVEFASSTQALRAIADGAVDGAALTLDETLLLRESGADVRVVLVMDYSAGADALVARDGINSLQQLKGKRIGAETTALGAYVMHRALEIAKLRLDEVTIVALDLSQHEQAFLDGAVDAVITFDPVRSRLLAQGGHVLLDSRQLPNEVVDLLVVRADRIPAHMEHLKELLKGWFATVEQISVHPATSALQLNNRMKLDESELLTSLQDIEFPNRADNLALLLGPHPSLLENARHMAAIMEDSRLLKKQVEIISLFDPPLLQELYPQ